MAFKFKYNKEESVGGDYIMDSGCLKMTIEKAEVVTYASGSEALVLDLTNRTKEEAKVKIFYMKGDGNEIKFNVRKMMQLAALTKTERAMDSGGEAFANAIEGKQIGVFLKVVPQKDKEGLFNRECEGFYDFKTELTFKEKLNNLEATTYYKKMKEYGVKLEVMKAVDVIEEEVSGHPDTVNGEDEFPF